MLIYAATIMYIHVYVHADNMAGLAKNFPCLHGNFASLLELEYLIQHLSKFFL